ncbi:hypothetical protein HAX54_018637 [Datura stramonium]|uniref:K+ potassium transporter integral membrane domain-containing protein n=1 Tax=Datura stramonium TaxID=4076 RepID=A0ABS8UQH9_DATST|nr:hypothetical protein [Datura stramonium]
MNLKGPAMDLETSLHHNDVKKEYWRTILTLAYQSLGVVYGDLSTSPLYVYQSTFAEDIVHSETNEEIYGVLSFVFWTLTLVPPLKYIFIVLKADDNGVGGDGILTPCYFRNQWRDDIVRDYKESCLPVFAIPFGTQSNNLAEAKALKFGVQWCFAEISGASSTNSNTNLLQNTPIVGARLPVVGNIICSRMSNQGATDAAGFKLDDEANSQFNSNNDCKRRKDGEDPEVKFLLFAEGTTKYSISSILITRKPLVVGCNTCDGAVEASVSDAGQIQNTFNSTIVLLFMIVFHRYECVVDLEGTTICFNVQEI